MMRTILIILTSLALAACQGVVGPNGQINGITVPAGCKAQGSIAFPVATGAISFSCDETGQPAPVSGAHIQLR